MGIHHDEQIRRRYVEILHRLYSENDKLRHVDDIQAIREQAIAEFVRRLDGKLANLQQGESLVMDIYLDIVRMNGKVRGGSGAERNMPEYVEWRNAVFARDGYRCRDCGGRGKLQAHHVKTWADHPALRFDVENGLTLCFACHSNRHPHIGWMNVTRDELAKVDANGPHD